MSQNSFIEKFKRAVPVQSGYYLFLTRIKKLKPTPKNKNALKSKK